MDVIKYKDKHYTQAALPALMAEIISDYSRIEIEPSWSAAVMVTVWRMDGTATMGIGADIWRAFGYALKTGSQHD